MASAAEAGMFEVKFSDQNEANPVPVFANHTNLISGGAKAAPTSETFKAIPRAFEGNINNLKCAGRVLIYFTSDATDIIESEESQWEIPILVYNLRGQLVTRKVLTQENMTGFTQAGTVDVTCTASVPSRIAYTDVPRGLLYALDSNGKIRAYMGDDTA